MLCAFFVLMGGSLHFGEAAAVQPTDGPTRPPSMSAEDEGADAPAVSEEPDASPSPAAEPEVFNLSFIGDITPDAVPYYRGSSVAYQNVVTADNLGYVFEKTVQYFEDDDFTMANFECVLSNYDVPADKNFTFRAPPEYVGILTSGSVEFVTLGNNHVEDYGEQGYADTKAALDEAGIGYAGRDEYSIYETESGLKIGVYAVSFGKVSQIQAGIAALKEAGAEFIIAALHWGDEGAYDVNSLQLEQGHAAIDAGADVVYGSHPHTLAAHRGLQRPLHILLHGQLVLRRQHQPARQGHRHRQAGGHSRHRRLRLRDEREAHPLRLLRRGGRQQLPARAL